MRVKLVSNREEEACLGAGRVSEKRLTRAVTITVAAAAAEPDGNVLCLPAWCCTLVRNPPSSSLGPTVIMPALQGRTWPMAWRMGPHLAVQGRKGVELHILQQILKHNAVVSLLPPTGVHTKSM